MSEKEEYAELPTRELPLSTVENTPPLMLDLPDGQQLVVGKLPDGIVIEIATWRGTGRPDSRTNRMMLGVTYDEDDVEETPKRSILKKIKIDNKDASNKISEKASTITVEAAAVESSAPEITKAAPAELPVKVLVEAPSDMPEALSTPEVVINDPMVEISQIIEEDIPVFKVEEPAPPARNLQDLMGARPRAQLQEQEKSSLLDRGHEIVRKSSAPKKKFSFDAKVLIKPIASIAACALAVFYLTGPAGVSFTLPVGGLKTSMSSAENALVIVKKASNYQIGDTVVAKVQAEKNPDYFATIAATSDTEYVLTENNLYHTALRNNVKGKVVLVMPGIGFLLKKIGL